MKMILTSVAATAVILTVTSAYSAPHGDDAAVAAYASLPTSTSSSPVSQEAGGYVFMDIKWDNPEDASDEAVEEAEMLAIADALERYVTPPPPGKIESPFCDKLTDWIVPPVAFSLPDVQSSIVKTIKDDKDGSDKVFAFVAEPLNAVREKAAADAERIASLKKDGDWAPMLAATYKSANAEERQTFMVLLGCPLVSFLTDPDSGRYGQPIEGCDAGWNEFQKIISWEFPRESFFSAHSSLLWPSYTGRRCFYPQWKTDDGNRFAKAKKMFGKGGDINKILDLIAQSIAINPINEEKWRYLGSALNVAGRHDDAVVAYCQAVVFDLASDRAWKGLQESCKKAGYDSTASGISWYRKMLQVP